MIDKEKTIEERARLIADYKVPVGDSYKVGHSKLLAFTIAISFLVLSLLYLIAGFSFYFLTGLVLWFLFYRYSRDTVVSETFEFARTTFVFFLVLIASFALFGLSAPKTFSSVKGSLSEYGNRVLTVRSSCNKAQGTIGLRVRQSEKTGEEFLEAYYNILITDKLTSNGLCGPDSALFGCDKNISYEYAGDLVAVNENGGIAEGGLVPVFCNKNRLPEDPFCEIPKEHSIQNCNVVGLNEETNTFLLQFIKKYSTYAELLESNKIDIYDGSYFWEKNDNDKSIDLVMNLDKAVSEGWKVATYELMIED